MKFKSTFFSRLMRPLLATAAFASLALSANAAAYIKFDGIDGESADKDHAQWSDLMSFSQAIHQPGGSATGATRERGTPVMEDLVCVKELDKASPKLMEAVCTGRIIPTVVIELTKEHEDGTETVYLRYELTNVMVTSYNVNASGNDEGSRSSTRCSLNFEEVKVTYTEYDRETRERKGNVDYNWKVEQGE